MWYMDGKGPEDWVLAVKGVEGDERVWGARTLRCSVAVRGEEFLCSAVCPFVVVLLLFSACGL